MELRLNQSDSIMHEKILRVLQVFLSANPRNVNIPIELVLNTLLLLLVVSSEATAYKIIKTYYGLLPSHLFASNSP